MCMDGGGSGSRSASRVRGSSLQATQRGVGTPTTVFNPGEYSRIKAMPNYTAMALGRGSYTGPTRIERETQTFTTQAELDAANKGIGPLTRQWRRSDSDGPATSTANRQDRVQIADEGSARRRTRGVRSQMQSETNFRSGRSARRKGTGLRIGSADVSVPGV